MENKNGLILDGLQMSTLAKITEKRVKKITMGELKEIFSKIDDHEIKLIADAIQSSNAERLQASIELPVYRLMEIKVSEGLKNAGE